MTQIKVVSIENIEQLADILEGRTPAPDGEALRFSPEDSEFLENFSANTRVTKALAAARETNDTDHLRMIFIGIILLEMQKIRSSPFAAIDSRINGSTRAIMASLDSLGATFPEYLQGPDPRSTRFGEIMKMLEADTEDLHAAIDKRAQENALRDAPPENSQPC